MADGGQATLADKVAVVTGAGSGIGRAIAVGLARAGAAVVGGDLHRDGLDETAGIVEQAGGQISVQTGDIRERATVERLVDEARSAFGGLDVMVVNAAISTYVPLEEMSEEQIDDILDIDLRGALLCAQASIRPMRERGGGSIVFLSSVQAFVTLPGCVPYAAAKAGLVAAARALAPEVGRDGIRVNAVAPGTIRTDAVVALLDTEQGRAYVEEIEARHPVGRLGEPGEVAEAIAYLASDAASFVTGAVLPVDGGYLAQ